MKRDGRDDIGRREMAIAESPLHDRRVLKAIDLMSTEYGSRLDAASLASRLNMSSSRLAHLFKATTGMTLSEFLRKVRLEAAAELLAATELRISEVCYSVGFESPVHFAAAFRKTFGVAPREYRDRIARASRPPMACGACGRVLVAQTTPEVAATLHK